jgi:NTP pyrophosphatase (non-canonical NTP hydrolase)
MKGGENVRGDAETDKFRQEMLRVINKPRNAAKCHWSEMTIEELWAKFNEEMVEVYEALENETPERQAEELIDLANVAMMLHERLAGATSRKAPLPP